MLLVYQEGYEAPQDSVVLVALPGLAVLLCVLLLRLVQIEQPSLLLEVLVVQAVDRVEVVGDEEHDEHPFELARHLHAEDQHEDDQLRKQQRLQDRVVAQEANCIVVLVEIGQASLNLLSSRVDADPFLEAVVHQRQPRHEKVLLWTHIRVNFVCLVVAVVLIVVVLGDLVLFHRLPAASAGAP